MARGAVVTSAHERAPGVRGDDAGCRGRGGWLTGRADLEACRSGQSLSLWPESLHDRHRIRLQQVEERWWWSWSMGSRQRAQSPSVRLRKRSAAALTTESRGLGLSPPPSGWQAGRRRGGTVSQPSASRLEGGTTTMERSGRRPRSEEAGDEVERRAGSAGAWEPWGCKPPTSPEHAGGDRGEGEAGGDDDEMGLERAARRPERDAGSVGAWAPS